MRKRRTSTPAKSQTTDVEIDRVVIAQADEDAAWQKAIVVRRPKSTSLSIPADLAARAAFLARLHHEIGYHPTVIRRAPAGAVGAGCERRRRGSARNATHFD